ncbi:hypothetical protein PHYSODRAFT_331303 [Phytophthora sojae]|uniref:Uncharacterized protein n=1 Tax=Phytophthora sojae (strain P6497) TaxID=1094619 RepID=G4ZCK2_PHYSP|nr:hypothetical protein PHYSODRAFT_331303 [Phytophthora sojae]EGZ17319.1 hypothetical protein PHYSODRAFT_331303 [Phytophthora sojae]|eukprot:XP_009526377.1 hypothetical protein PHYSODRAFT_331303 [Phytophthora sojae]
MTPSICACFVGGVGQGSVPNGYYPSLGARLGQVLVGTVKPKARVEFQARVPPGHDSGGMPVSATDPKLILATLDVRRSAGEGGEELKSTKDICGSTGTTDGRASSSSLAAAAAVVEVVAEEGEEEEEEEEEVERVRQATMTLQKGGRSVAVTAEAAVEERGYDGAAAAYCKEKEGAAELKEREGTAEVSARRTRVVKPAGIRGQGRVTAVEGEGGGDEGAVCG